MGADTVGCRDGRGQVSEDEGVLEIIKPLGLFDTRIRGLREVTERFLSMPRFIIGAIPHAPSRTRCCATQAFNRS